MPGAVTSGFMRSSLGWKVTAQQISLLGFCGALFGSGAAFAQSAALPNRVHFKTPSQGFCWENEYALSDGKIWVRPNVETSGKEGAWTLFDGTGIPFGEKAASFRADQRVLEFATDGTMVLAVSNSGRFYNWQPTLSARTVWMDKMGAPFEEDLYLPRNRAWGFSLSVAVAPEKRLTPMHDIVSYYEDADGNKIQFGFTATLFVLDPDGQRIRYWDTGLPASFHKAFATPDRGRFVAVNLSTAASTLFVVDGRGRMFTKMHDYEMFAACPGLRYTYQRERRTRSDAEIMPLLSALRTLPLPDWRPQEPIPLHGDAVMSSVITILQNGQGNAARELRVQGRDGEGREGYWFKPIFAPSWAFRVTGQRLDESKILRNVGQPPVLGPPMDKSYRGRLTRAGAKSLEVELLDFYYYAPSATLRVHLGAKHFDVLLHLVDAWGPTVQQKFHPELVGSVAGEPKLLMGTIEIPPEVSASIDPDIVRVLSKYFQPFHLATFAFEVAANDGQVSLLSRVVQRQSTDYVDYKVRPFVHMNFTRELSAEEVAVDDGFTYLATLPGLQVPELDKLNRRDLPRLEKALQLNEQVLKQIRETSRNNRIEHLKQGTLSATGSAAFAALNGLISLVGLPARHPLAGGLTLSGGVPLNMYARLDLKLALSNSQDYERAERLLEQRISKLQERRAALSRKRSPP